VFLKKVLSMAFQGDSRGGKTGLLAKGHSAPVQSPRLWNYVLPSGNNYPGAGFLLRLDVCLLADGVLLSVVESTSCSDLHPLVA
jgi:hypothetical protein